MAGEGASEEFVEPIPGVHVELSEKGEVMGVEIMDASKLLEPLIKRVRAKVSQRLSAP